MTEARRGPSGPWRTFRYVGVAIVLLSLLAFAWNWYQTNNSSNSGGVPAADLPPAGSVWFGSSFDATTFAISGRGTTFANGAQVVLVAHLSAKISEGQSATVTIDSYPMPTKAAGAGGADVYGWVIPSWLLTAGGHTVTVTDVGGNQLASGTLLTILP